MDTVYDHVNMVMIMMVKITFVILSSFSSLLSSLVSVVVVELIKSFNRWISLARDIKQAAATVSWLDKAAASRSNLQQVTVPGSQHRELD